MSSLLITLFCCIGSVIGSLLLGVLAMSSHLILALVVDVFGRLFDRDDHDHML